MYLRSRLADDRTARVDVVIAIGLVCSLRSRLCPFLRIPPKHEVRGIALYLTLIFNRSTARPWPYTAKAALIREFDDWSQNKSRVIRRTPAGWPGSMAGMVHDDSALVNFMIITTRSIDVRHDRDFSLSRGNSIPLK